MYTVTFVSELNKDTITKKMKTVPRIGDTIPLFFNPWPKVKQVMWFPEEVYETFKNADALIFLE